MKRRKKVMRKKHNKVRRERDPIPWKYCVLTVVCGLLLVSGFFSAATLHFSSIDYGMKNSSLRRQVEELRSQRRRLKLSREIALAPSGIRKAGRKIGLRKLTSQNIEIASRRKMTATKLGRTSDDLSKRSVKTFTQARLSSNAKRDTDAATQPEKADKRNRKEKSLDALIARNRRDPVSTRRR